MFYRRLKDPPNTREMKLPEGGENGRRKMISAYRNVDITHSVQEDTKSRGVLF